MPLHEPRRQRQQQSSVSLIITGVLLTLALLLGTGDAAAVRRVRRSATADDHYAYADDGGSLGGNNAYDRIMINYDEYPVGSVAFNYIESVDLSTKKKCVAID